MKCTSEEEYVERLEAMVEKEGMGRRPSKAKMQETKARLQTARELDGMDSSNIVQGGSRRRAGGEIKPSVVTGASSGCIKYNLKTKLKRKNIKFQQDYQLRRTFEKNEN